MGSIPVVPTFPAGLPATGAAMQELCTALTWCFSGRPVAEFQQASAQTISTSTTTAVTWDTKITDRDSGWSSGSNTRYTSKTPGIYDVTASVPYASNSTGYRQTWFRVTTGSNNPAGAGVTTQFGVASYFAAGNAGACARFLTPYLYVSDYVEVLTWQTSGGNLALSVAGGQGPPWFSVVLVSG